MAFMKASGTRAGGSQSETWPSSVLPDMYSKSWICPMGQSKPFTFSDLGDVPLLCNVHPEMAGYIFVVPTPYFAVTDKDGNFVIKNVPAGSYTLKTSSEGGKPASQSVTVGAGAVNANLTVTK